jgi:bacillithiol biosynthesis deacetylase BshB1
MPTTSASATSAASAPLDLLVVATHPDDAEISVGGTILQCKSLGMTVGVLDLTDGEPTPHGTLEKRAAETAAASQVLGLDWRGNLGLPNRKLEANLASRRKLAEVFRLARPGIVLAPYWEDSHPDHVAASALCDTARFWAKLSRTDLAGEPFHPLKVYYYWSIHLRIHSKPAFVLDVSDHIEKKLEAIHCYESQFAHGPQAFPTVLDDIRDRARYWGWTIHRAYGEPFASREEIGVSDLRVLSATDETRMKHG